MLVTITIEIEDRELVFWTPLTLEDLVHDNNHDHEIKIVMPGQFCDVLFCLFQIVNWKVLWKSQKWKKALLKTSLKHCWSCQKQIWIPDI